MITEGSSLTDVAFETCTALHERGFVAVLTGGSAAPYYAPDAYQSRDLDFVITFRGDRGGEALQALGFQLKGNFYVHQRSAFSVDFPPGPLAIGADPVTKWSTVRRGVEVLHVLSPTDSCRDRLASYLFWNDLAGLEQALAVHAARQDEVDMRAIRNWCRRENHEEKFGLFEARVAASHSR